MPQNPRTDRSADPGTMRSINRALVLDVIKREGPMSRAAIARASSLGKPTVSAITHDLLTDGIVREIGIDRVASASGGRPPVLLEFNARSRTVVGVHIGVGGIRIALADGVGTEIRRRSLDSQALTPEVTLERIADSIRAMLSDVDVIPHDVDAIGVSVPGQIDFVSGTCLSAPNLGWRDVPVASKLRESLGIETSVHNTAQAAVVAEAREGAARGVKNVVLIYAGLGVGSGIIADGRLFHGAHGVAGEIGHAAVPGGTNHCACGKIGCVETLASGPALVREARKALSEGLRSSLEDSGDSLSPLTIAAAARDGDSLASRLLRDVGTILGTAASWLVTAVDPELLLVGGGLVGAGPALLEPFEVAVREQCLPRSIEHLSVRPWGLGQDAKLRGAVLLALRHSDKGLRLVFGAA